MKSVELERKILFFKFLQFEEILQSKLKVFNKNLKILENFNKI